MKKLAIYTLVGFCTSSALANDCYHRRLRNGTQAEEIARLQQVLRTDLGCRAGEQNPSEACRESLEDLEKRVQALRQNWTATTQECSRWFSAAPSENFNQNYYDQLSSGRD